MAIPRPVGPGGNFNWHESAEGFSLDFGPIETVHRWGSLPECAEFVGARRSKHTVVAYKSEALYVFGGDDGERMLNDLLRFAVKEKSWSRAITIGTPPAPRYHHSAVVNEGSMFIFGGYTGDIHSNSNLANKNDLFEYKFATGQWTEKKFEGKLPAPRSAHGAAVYNDKLWVFGGYDGNARLNDLWTTNLHTGDNYQWQMIEQTGDIPPTRCNFAIAVARDSMFVFSGQSGANITNDLFQYNFEANFWTRISTEHILRGGPPPPKRYGHTMVAYDRHLYVFGGVSGSTVPKELHSYDLDSMAWSIVKPSENSQLPTERLFHAAGVVKDVMFIFGGTTDSNGRNGELYSFQFSSYPKCTLHDDFEQLLDSGQFCDVGFIVGKSEVKVHAHIAIVAARSSWLREKIRHARDNKFAVENVTTTESTDNEETSDTEQDTNHSADNSTSSSSSIREVEVYLSDAEPEAFQLVLSYIYTDRIHPQKLKGLSSNAVILLMMDVNKLAIQFEMSRLQQLCLHYLEVCVTPSNVLVALENADRLQLDDFKECCLKFIVRESNYQHIVYSDDFERLPGYLMAKIVRQRENRRVQNIPQCPIEKHLSLTANTLETDMELFLTKTGHEFCDFTLMLDGEPIQTHMSIMASRCAYFECMFRSMMPENKTTEIRIGDIIPSRQAFDSLLRYLYYADVTMPTEDALYLFSASYFYTMTNNRLQAYCKHNLETNISPDNVIQILEASDKINISEMKKHSLSIIVANFKDVAKLPALQTLSQPLLVDVVTAVAEAYPDQREHHPLGNKSLNVLPTLHH